jgi:flagellar motor switch protein FliN/FliY
MTTNTNVDTFGAVAASMVESAVDAVQQAAGIPIAVDDVELVPTVAAEALAAAAVARSMVHTDGGAGGLVVVVPATGLPGAGATNLEAAGLIDALAIGAATGLSRAIGRSFQASPAEALPPDPGIVGMATHIVRFAIGTGAGAPILVHWIVEASLGALTASGAPVAPAGEGPSVAPATLPELGETAGLGPQRDLYLLADVPMNVTVELGRAVMQVRDLLAMREGSIVELDRAAGAVVDVLVNGTLVARGDVVVVDDDLGVRITEIVER